MLNDFFKLIRIKHWLKSSFVFLGLLFSDLWAEHFITVLWAALAFSLAASGVYLYNDIQDIERDRAHPLKRFRLIASGQMKPLSVWLFIAILSSLALMISFFISLKAVVIVLNYLFINILYSRGLKHIPVVDVLCIGAGFMLRILMGTWAVGISPSWWLMICGTLLSLFLAFSKRKLEYQHSSMFLLSLTRPALSVYSLKWLNVFLLFTAFLFLSSYFLYTVYMDFYRPVSVHLLLTLPLVLIGFFRYIYLIQREESRECPVSIFFSDQVSLVNLVFFLLLVMMLLH